MLSSSLLFCLILKGVYSSNGLPNLTYVEPEYLEYLLEEGMYEVFARLLQIDNVHMVKPVEGETSDNPMFNKDLEGGDILLRPWQRVQDDLDNIEAAKVSKWKRDVPFVINRKDYTLSETTVILKAIGKWNQDLSRHIRFRPRISEKDYVIFFNGAGCYSNLGKVGGQQSISLSAHGCLTEGTILHEMAHAVGIIHEHSRRDRDKFITILFENIPEDWQPVYNKFGYARIKYLGQYDYDSVMHIPIPAPETGLPAFKVPPGIDPSRIGQREALSKEDQTKIKYLYS